MTPSFRSSTSFILVLWSLLLLFSSCRSDRDPAERVGNGLHVENPWARPASEGRMSAVYLQLSNRGEPADTLVGASSDVASLVEVHESYEVEEDLMGMRHVEELPIPAGKTVRLEQGGLHIMLIQLNRELQEGDQVSLTLHFSRAGDMDVQVPVRPAAAP